MGKQQPTQPGWKFRIFLCLVGLTIWMQLGGIDHAIELLRACRHV